MHSLAVQKVTATDINYISVTNMKTECIPWQMTSSLNGSCELNLSLK